MSRRSTLVLVLTILLVGGWLAYARLTSALPSVDDLQAAVRARLAAHGGVYAPLAAIPQTVQQATVVTEDERFFSHAGVDPLGILRAILDDALRRCLCEGGSTITQQLAKQVYLGGDDASPRRKLDTVLLAIAIERRYTKDQILELYLNTAYYGHGAYGAAAAAEVYWRRPIGRVDLAQAAMLAGLPQAPAEYDPLEHPAAAAARRAQVLDRLVSTGHISDEQARRAGAQPVASRVSESSGTVSSCMAS